MTKPKKVVTSADILVDELSAGDRLVRSADRYASVIKSRYQTVIANAGDYRSVPNNPAAIRPKLTKVLSDAVFIPAPRSAFLAGAFNVDRLAGMVIHRIDALYNETKKIRTSSRYATSLVSAVFDTLAVTKSQSSAHFLIGYGGELVQMVDLADRAWHAGVNTKNAVGGDTSDKNVDHVGVELEGAIEDPLTQAQLEKLAWLIKWTSTIGNFEVSTKTIKRHSDIDKDRRDPGTFYDDQLVFNMVKLVKLEKKPHDYFRQPFDPLEIVQDQMSQFMAASGAPQTQLESMQAYLMSTNITSLIRSFRDVGLTRTVMDVLSYARARTNDNKAAGNTALILSNSRKLVQEIAWNQVVSGVLFDFERGIWNDEMPEGQLESIDLTKEPVKGGLT